MKLFETSKSRGWVVAICLVVVFIITLLNKYDTHYISENVEGNKVEIAKINDLLKDSKLRQDTIFGSIKVLQDRKTRTIYNTKIIENEHEAKIRAYDKLDTSEQLGFLTDWIIEQERLSQAN